MCDYALVQVPKADSNSLEQESEAAVSHLQTTVLPSKEQYTHSTNEASPQPVCQTYLCAEQSLLLRPLFDFLRQRLAVAQVDLEVTTELPLI